MAVLNVLKKRIQQKFFFLAAFAASLGILINYTPVHEANWWSKKLELFVGWFYFFLNIPNFLIDNFINYYKVDGIELGLFSLK